MLILQILFSVISVAYLISVSTYLMANKLFLKGLFINATSGLGLLFFLKLVENFFDIEVYINSLTVLVSLLLGPVGVIMNLLVDYVVI